MVIIAFGHWNEAKREIVAATEAFMSARIAAEKAEKAKNISMQALGVLHESIKVSSGKYGGDRLGNDPWSIHGERLIKEIDKLRQEEEKGKSGKSSEKIP